MSINFILSNQVKYIVSNEWDWEKAREMIYYVWGKENTHSWWLTSRSLGPSSVSVWSVSDWSISLGNNSTSKSILENIFLWSPSSTWNCSFLFFWSSCCLQISSRFSEIKLLHCFSSCSNCTRSCWYKSCNAQFYTITPSQSLINEALMRL